MPQAISIYQRLTAMCATAGLPLAWQKLPCCADFFELPAEDVLRQTLLAEFPEDELRAAGLYTEDGQLALPLRSPAGQPKMVFELRTQAEAAPHALLVGEELVGTNDSPFMGVLQDYRLKAMLEKSPETLYVTGSINDMAILWALELPAVPIHGLETLAGDDLELFCAALHIRRFDGQDGDAEDDADSMEGPDGSEPATPKLLFVNWAVAHLELDELAETSLAGAHLLDLQTYLDLKFENLETWQPNAWELDRLSFCAKVGNRIDIVGAVQDSLADSRLPFLEHSEEEPAEPKPPKYQELLQRWIRGVDDTSERRDLWKLLLHCQEVELIVPILDAADGESDPVRRNQYLVLAVLSREFHTLAARLAGDAADQIDVPATWRDQAEQRSMHLERRMTEISDRLKSYGKSAAGPNRAKAQATEPPIATLMAAAGLTKRQ